MQTMPIPLLSSILNLQSHHQAHSSHCTLPTSVDIPTKSKNGKSSSYSPHELKRASSIPFSQLTPVKGKAKLSVTQSADYIPAMSTSYREREREREQRECNAISTELECFITKSSSSSGNGDDCNSDPFDADADENTLSVMVSSGAESDEEAIRSSSKQTRRRHRGIGPLPEWLQWLSSWDRACSSIIHRLHLGSLDYLFVMGAFLFGSKFMPITILLSALLVDVPGFIYLLLSCTVTVSLSQCGKKLFARHRPEHKQLAPRKLDFRSRLTNYSFPSGDTAQSAAYSMTLFLLTDKAWLLLLIPNCAWSRVYFGCHWICDCISGALLGCLVPLLIWSMIPRQSFEETQQSFASLMG